MDEGSYGRTDALEVVCCGNSDTSMGSSALQAAACSLVYAHSGNRLSNITGSETAR